MVGPVEGLDTLNFVLWKDARTYIAATPLLQIALFKISASCCHLYLNAQRSPGRYHLTVPSVFQETLSLIRPTVKTPFTAQILSAYHISLI